MLLKVYLLFETQSVQHRGRDTNISTVRGRSHPFAGKMISATGASQGLGLALSKYLLVCGATVSCVDDLGRKPIASHQRDGQEYSTRKRQVLDMLR